MNQNSLKSFILGKALLVLFLSTKVSRKQAKIPKFLYYILPLPFSFSPYWPGDTSTNEVQLQLHL